MKNATPIIFADDTSILITGQDVNKVQDDLTLTLFKYRSGLNKILFH